jgi:hypothetical protein
MRRLIQHGGKAFRGSYLQQRIVTGALLRHGLTDRVAWPRADSKRRNPALRQHAPNGSLKGGLFLTRQL